MTKYGLLIDMERCIGCRTHEVICRSQGSGVVRLKTVPLTIEIGDNRVTQFVPFLQQRCSRSPVCAKRIKNGLKPACVEQCPARARIFDEINKLSSYISNKKSGEQVYIERF